MGASLLSLVSLLPMLTTALPVTLPVPDTPLIRRGNLPDTIAVSTAISYLSEIRTAPEANGDSYDRDLFRHWITNDSCNTREVVLERDGTDVVQGSDCSAESGEWFSDYDGATWSRASEVDIDHVVPLKEAWVSGASSWTNARREEFANDLDLPQLLAVTSSVNRAKSDSDLAEWLPPRRAFRCIYVRAWIHVKRSYGLSMDQREKSAASEVLYNVC